MKKLTKRPAGHPLRKIAIPFVAGAFLATTGGCIQMDVVGVEAVPEQEPPPDGGAEPDDAGTEPDAQPDVGVIDAGVSASPEDEDAGEPGVDG